MKEKLLEVRKQIRFAQISFEKINKQDDLDKLIASSAVVNLDESLALLDSIISILDSPWQPIETLPLSGRVLMWWTPINNNPLAECVIIGEAAYVDEDYLAEGWKPTKYWDGVTYKDLARITHWMRLPQPPTAIESIRDKDNGSKN